jgi:hypothetical protein
MLPGSIELPRRQFVLPGRDDMAQRAPISGLLTQLVGLGEFVATGQALDSAANRMRSRTSCIAGLSPTNLPVAMVGGILDRSRANRLSRALSARKSLKIRTLPWSRPASSRSFCVAFNTGTCPPSRRSMRHSSSRGMATAELVGTSVEPKTSPHSR